MKLLFFVLLASFALPALAEVDYRICIDENTQCQTDCCIQNGGHFTENNEIDCQDFEGDYMAACGEPCQDAYEQCMGYGTGGDDYGTGEYEPAGYDSGSSGSCCGSAFVLAAGMLAVGLCARKG